MTTFDEKIDVEADLNTLKMAANAKILKIIFKKGERPSAGSLTCSAPHNLSILSTLRFVKEKLPFALRAVITLPPSLTESNLLVYFFTLYRTSEQLYFCKI